MADPIKEDFIDTEAEIIFIIEQRHASPEFKDQKAHITRYISPVLFEPAHENREVFDVKQLYQQFWEAEELHWKR